MSVKVLKRSGSKIIKQGWLKKQGGLVKSWHWRWFVLNDEHLFYFAKEDDIKFLGNIHLCGNRIVELPFRPEEPDKFYFEIFPGQGQTKMAPNHDSFLLCGSSLQDIQEWISAIRRVMYAKCGGAIFGQNLSETLEFEKQRGRDLPFIVEQCVTFILEHGIECEGILRMAGRTSLLREVKEMFDMGIRVVFNTADHDVHTVASLLKTYFRELPESIIPCDLFQKFMNNAYEYQKQKSFDEIMKLKGYLDLLPNDNYRILAYICCFLDKIASKCDKNKMTAWNLATVFGPNIIRHIDDNPTLFMATADLNQELAHMMINNVDYLFPKEGNERLHKHTKNELVPVDELLRLSIANDSFEILTPEKFDMTDPFKNNESSRSSNGDKRHARIDIDSFLDSKDPSNPGQEVSPLPIPALRRSKKRGQRSKCGVVDIPFDKVIANQSHTLPNANELDKLRSRKSLERTYSAPSSELNAIKRDGLLTCGSSSYQDVILSDEIEMLKEKLVDQELTFRDQIRDLQRSHEIKFHELNKKLSEEQMSKAEVIERVMELQAQLTNYQLKYGELEPT